MPAAPLPEAELGTLLARLPLFEGLAPARVASLCGDVPLIRYEPDAALMRQGEVERLAYVIVSGRVAVRVDTDTGTVEIAKLGKGALIGEIALLCEIARTASVIALEPTACVAIDPALLDSWCTADSRIATNVLRLMANRLAATVQPVAYFMAAARALREDHFDPAVLSGVRERNDEIGNFARAFLQMADAIRERETALRREIQELTIRIDETKRARQVAEITDTDYFRNLQSRVRDLRARQKGPR
jgi:CRP-like cAMP-binding protein